MNPDFHTAPQRAELLAHILCVIFLINETTLHCKIILVYVRLKFRRIYGTW